MPSLDDWKKGIEAIESIITIFAILLGGYWNYSVFIQERKNIPHADISQKVEHFPLTSETNLVRVDISIKNTGTSRLILRKTKQIIQQILPIIPCSKKEVCAQEQLKVAFKNIKKNHDRFSWPAISRRESYLMLDIEPGESEKVDFEFAIPSNISLLRVYSYFKNEKKEIDSNEIGWAVSTIYNLKTTHEENND